MKPLLLVLSGVLAGVLATSAYTKLHPPAPPETDSENVQRLAKGLGFAKGVYGPIRVRLNGIRCAFVKEREDALPFGICDADPEGRLPRIEDVTLADPPAVGPDGIPDTERTKVR